MNGTLWDTARGSRCCRFQCRQRGGRDGGAAPIGRSNYRRAACSSSLRLQMAPYVSQTNRLNKWRLPVQDGALRRGPGNRSLLPPINPFTPPSPLLPPTKPQLSETRLRPPTTSSRSSPLPLKGPVQSILKEVRSAVSGRFLQTWQRQMAANWEQDPDRPLIVLGEPF